MRIKLNLIWVVVSILFLTSCNFQKNNFPLHSPDHTNRIEFRLIDGEAFYTISRNDSVLIKNSKMGFHIENQKDLTGGFEVLLTEARSKSDEWNPIWGEKEAVIDQFNELIVHLETEQGRRLDVFFRAYNDGVAFRYHFPGGDTLETITILDELTEFNFNDDMTSWSIPANFDSYEFLYREMKLSELEDANTPLTLKADFGTVMSIHEAHLVDYSEMTLAKSSMFPLQFKAQLAPSRSGILAEAKTPFNSPWRTFQLADNESELLQSDLIANLNPPSVLENTDWIKPMKYVGVWWEMHIGLSSWELGKRHGATTQNTKKYIDFAADHNIQGVLVEGWNTGWENWGDSGAFSFVTPYKDFNIQELQAYGLEKGVSLIGHHETGGDAYSYEQELDTAFAFYNALGIHSVKTGYAGRIRPEGEYHHGQYMVNHYRKVIEKAAEYELMVDAHEPIKSTGEHRTYPNMMTREGARGMEWNAWSDGNPPSHTCILPFTRCLSGPLDYTPGIFDLLIDYREEDHVNWNGNGPQNRVHTTLSKQLALMSILYSPLQMAADLVENYQDHEALVWIEQLPVSFDEKLVLEASIGHFLTIARRADEKWFIAGISDEESRTAQFSLDFLEDKVQYESILICDTDSTHWETNPSPYQVVKRPCNSEDEFKVKIAPGGGFVLIINPLKD